jgi:hypothetical protein
MASFQDYQLVRCARPLIYFMHADGHLEFVEDEAEQPQALDSASSEALLEDEVHQEPTNNDASSKSTEAEGQREPQSNGTYSESLTRLQAGYLHAISVLDERLMRQQQELDLAHADLQHMDFLQHQNKQLTLDLNASRSVAQEMRSAPLEKKLAEKNAILKDKNKKIFDLEQTIGRLQNELYQPKRELLGVRAWLPGQQNHNNVSAGATTTHATIQGATPAAARKSDFGTKGGYEKPTGQLQQDSYKGALRMEPTPYDRKNIGATEEGTAAKKRRLIYLKRAGEDGLANQDFDADQVVRGGKVYPFVID